MGMERTISLTGPAPPWSVIRHQLEVVGLQVQLRMIDGLPAFPDETPEDRWRELRFGTSSGMMTLRSEPGQLSVAVWGNADENLKREWELVATACASAVNQTKNPCAIRWEFKP